MGKLREQLLEAGYRLTEDLERQVETALKTRPCAGGFLMGPAGAGKTFLAEAVAAAEERETFFFQAFPGCRKEELFQTILPDASQPSGFRTLAGVLPQAAESSQQGPTALILDEWDKTHPSTDAFLLDFLQTGRVSVPGSQVRANQENLVVFITLNDERELSEPLLRRMPTIELKAAPPQLVAYALSDTHGNHPYLHAAVTLYRRSRLVNLSKPVTIQELRQLLDAITHLGSQADWNRLVFQYVTKHWDDHELLKSAESLPLNVNLGGERDEPVLNVEQYSGGEALPRDDSGIAPLMPRVQRDWLDKMPSGELEADPAGVYGVVPRSESGYDGVARAYLHRKEPGVTTEDPADFSFAKVGESEIIVFKPLSFDRMEEWGRILQDGGELLMETEHLGEILPEHLQEFNAGIQRQNQDDQERCRIYSLTDSEMLMRYRSMKIRWTAKKLEVVAREFEPAREFWEFLFGPRGLITAARLVEERMNGGEPSGNGLPSNEQLKDDYLFVLRDFRYLRQWFSLLINRNLKVWGRVTCDFTNKSVKGSILPVENFSPEKENPETKEEADSISLFNQLTQPALDFYESHIAQIESELGMFVTRNGEFPPAVEDGGIFSLYEVHSDLDKIKREGLKGYMRKVVREA